MFLMYCRDIAFRLVRVAAGKVLNVEWKLSEAHTLKKLNLVKFVKNDQSNLRRSQLDTEIAKRVLAADAKAPRLILMLVKRLGQFKFKFPSLCLPMIFAGIKVSLPLGVRVKEIVAVLVKVLKTLWTVATGTRLQVTRAFVKEVLLQMQGATLDWQFAEALTDGTVAVETSFTRKSKA
jgi:hypothetical protein